VSAMSATVVTSLSPTCRCLISVGDRFPEILLKKIIQKYYNKQSTVSMQQRYQVIV